MTHLEGRAKAASLSEAIRCLLIFAVFWMTASAADAQIRIVAVGDSSFRGGPSMIDQQDTYPARLEHALREKGYRVTVSNEGINGELAPQTRFRLDTAVPNGTQIAIVATGGNDMVRGASSRSEVFSRLKDIVASLRARGIEVLVFNLGGRVPPAQIAEETRDLQALGAVAVPPMQSGGLVDRTDLHVESFRKPGSTLWHLNREGNDIVVGRTLPIIEKMISRVH